MAEAAPPPPSLRFYRRPPASSPDAYRIWNDCCLGEVAEVTDIYWALDTWARLNCLIEMRNNIPYLFWTSPTGVRHECFADTFAHWLLCACEEYKPQAPPLPPQPLTPTTSTWNLETIAEEAMPVENSEAMPVENSEAMPVENSEAMPVENSEAMPVEAEATNEIIFHDVQKIGDEADEALIKTLKEELKISLEEVMQMDLEHFLNSTEED